MADDDEKPKPPHLRLVVENDKQAVSEEWARLHLVGPIEDLAANILRVIRGAGRPTEIYDLCGELLDAFQDFRAKTGHWPRGDQIAGILNIENAMKHEPTERDRAVNRIARGSLQFLASRMLGQRSQQSAGEYEIYDGIRDLEAERERARNAVYSRKARKQRQPEPEEEINLGPAPKKKVVVDKVSTPEKPIPPKSQPAPHSKKPDRKTPPSYERCTRYQMTTEEKAEFRVNGIDDLVAIANAYLIAAGRWPLTQADFPGNKSGFVKVAKMVRAFRTKEAP